MTEARIASINTSDGGVPKLPRDECWVGRSGLRGDRQRDLRHHGGPDRAVCLYSLERIDELRAEGHPVEVGSLGENLTVTGLDWSTLLPGARLRVGAVRLEVTGHAAPCANLTPFFQRGDFTRVSSKLHAGWSRLYARVLEEGSVKAGDAVELQSA